MVEIVMPCTSLHGREDVPSTVVMEGFTLVWYSMGICSFVITVGSSNDMVA